MISHNSLLCIQRKIAQLSAYKFLRTTVLPKNKFITMKSSFNSGHIGNPFSPLFHPHCSEYPAIFHLMWPRIKNQKILDPVWVS